METEHPASGKPPRVCLFFFFLEGREGVFRARFGKFSFFSFLFFPFNLPHVQDELQDVAMEEPYVEFASYCNSLTTFLWWEGSVYAILSFLLPPAARLWLQWRRLIRSKKLELFVSVEYRHTFLVRMPTWLEMAGVKYIYIFLEMIGCTCENCCCRKKQKSCRARALRDGISFYSSLGHSFACIEILLRDDDMRGKYNTTSSGLDIGLLQSSGIQMGKN